MLTKFIKKSPVVFSILFLFMSGFLPLSVWANVQADKSPDPAVASQQAPGFWVKEVVRRGLSFEVAQYEYTDHTMRFELGGSSSGGKPSGADSSDGVKPASREKSVKPKNGNSGFEPTYPIFRGNLGRYSEEDRDPFEAEEEDLPVLTDPFVSYNQYVFQFNDDLFTAIIDPVAQVYKDLVHEEIRIAIRNLFRNALAPIRFVSSLIQLNLDKAGRVLVRVFINTTLGVGGLFDVAKKDFGINSVNEDMGQALGYHGIASGPYIVLPILGPSTARDVVGRVADSFLNPAVVFSPGFLPGMAISGTYMINETSFVLEGKRQIEEGAVDKYESWRDFYHQYREQLIRK